MSSYDFILNGKKINDRILNFKYSENFDDVASSFEFDYVDDSDIQSRLNKNYVRKPFLSEIKANFIELNLKGTNTLVYKGVITDWVHTTDVNKYHISGFDVGFYLNKNKVIKQFRAKDNVNIGTAIGSLCAYYDIAVGELPQFKNKVAKIYRDKIFADVLKDLLKLEKDKGGLRNVYIDCKNGGLEIKKYKNESSLSVLIANAISVAANKTINEVTVTKSIQDLKNQVIYIDDQKKMESHPKPDEKSIKAFGLLQAVEHPDADETKSLDELAADKLAELNKIKETFSLSMIGDYRISKGKVIKLEVNKYELNGFYLIKTVSHNIDSKKEIVNMTVELVI